MRVDRDVRLPAEIGGDPGPGLGLGLEEPVAVHVEEVMVVPPGRPPLDPLGGERLGIGGDAPVLAVEVDEPIAAVGVLHRVDDHDDLVEQRLGSARRSASR